MDAKLVGMVVEPPMTDVQQCKPSIEKIVQFDMLITKDSLRPPCKRQRTRSTTKENNNSVEGAVNDGTVTSTNNNENFVKIKCRRPREQWSDEDQERFFHGIAELGKDYGKIQMAMKKRCRGKHDYDAKTKEQIRHFYHRTWSKISKNLKLQPELDPKRACRREIHYMICLGELRKKGAQGFGQKVMRQLNELVTQGCTNIRCKGRNIRVRPPNRFLRKFYKNSIPDVILPKHINIEFLPYTNSAFNFVQKYAFNPRLRFTNVNINSKFSEIFEMFDKRFTDLYSSNSLVLHIYPLQTPNKDCNEFARLLVEAKDRIETHVKSQDIPIVLEEATKAPTREEDVIVSEDNETFPKIFGKNTDSVHSSEEFIKPFLGYWTYQSAELIYLRTLYLALGENELMKFKYDWKNVEGKAAPTLHAESFQFFQTLCNTENKIKKDLLKERTAPVIAPKRIPVHVPNVVKIENGLPLRPRPGRRCNYKNRVIQKRFIVPRINGSNNNNSCNKLVSNAVAVNYIPQPQQLLQFAQMLPDKAKLVNSGSSIKSPLQFSSEFTGIQPITPDVVVTEATSSSSVIHEEVLEEGYNEDYKALSHILSAFAKDSDNSKPPSLGSPPIADISPTSPKSPNLDWLHNEASVDISMTSFLNVDLQQQLQQKIAENAYQQKVDHSLMKPRNIDHLPLKASNDPTLPEFHSGDTNGPYFGVTFN